MGFSYILNKVASQHGYDVVNNADQRSYLTDKINEAARDIYDRQDIPFQLKECFIRVTPDNELSLPPFVKELRAVRPGCRDYCTEKWQLHTQWPKYNKSQWASDWKSWRIKGTSPTAVEFDNIAPITAEIHVADATCDLTVVGENEHSNNIVETLPLSATSISFTKSIQTFKRIFKSKKTDYNIIIKDADGNEISMIYADQTEARFTIVDVSKYPQNLYCSDANCGDGTYIMEVLFKPILADMTLDTDSFPVDGYDDHIVTKAMQLLAELEEGKEQRAILLERKLQVELNKTNQDKTGPLNKRLTFAPNPTFKDTGYYEYPYGSWKNY